MVLLSAKGIERACVYKIDNEYEQRTGSSANICHLANKCPGRCEPRSQRWFLCHGQWHRDPLPLVRIDNQRLGLRWSGRLTNQVQLRLIENYTDKSIHQFVQIMIKHRTFSPDCPFVQNPNSSGNVPLNSSNLISSSDMASVDLMNEQCRLATFYNWPVSWTANWFKYNLCNEVLIIKINLFSISRLPSSHQKHWPKPVSIISIKRITCAARGVKES